MEKPDGHESLRAAEGSCCRPFVNWSQAAERSPDDRIHRRDVWFVLCDLVPPPSGCAEQAGFTAETANVALRGGHSLVVLQVIVGAASASEPPEQTFGDGAVLVLNIVQLAVGILMLVVSGLYMIRREARLRRRQDT